jgi:hypothetical protein
VVPVELQGSTLEQGGQGWGGGEGGGEKEHLGVDARAQTSISGIPDSVSKRRTV